MVKEEVLYSVIGKWTENDGVEKWDIINVGPLTYDDALKIATNAGKTWDDNVLNDNKNVQHKEIVMKYESLQKMIIIMEQCNDKD